MSNTQGSHTLLDVPYFQQTRITTCGSACLMMVMKYWDHSLNFSRKFELQLWKKSYSFFLLGGTFQFGLAATATKLGFKTEIYQNVPFSDCYPKFPQAINLIENIVSYRARHLHIPIQYKQDNLLVINNALHRSIPPIIFVNLYPLIGENVFHWVVVTGLDEQNVYVNDPYIPRKFALKQKKNYPIALDMFFKAMATETEKKLRFPSCIVLVYRSNNL